MLKKEYLIYFFVAGVISLVFLSLFYLTFFGGRQQQTPSPSPTLIPLPSISPGRVDRENINLHPDSSTVVQTIDKAAEEMLDKDARIGKLIKKLPYQGNYFSLSYNYQDNIFSANLSTDNRSLAEQEFNQFLKENQIENRAWLYNLKINYE